MHIVFLSREYPPALHGGIGTYTYEMAHALSNAGCNVKVISWTDAEETIEQDESVEVHRVRPYLVKPFCRRPLKWLHLYDIFPATGDWVGWSYAASQRVKRLSLSTPVDVVEAPDNAAEGYMATFLPDTATVVKFHYPRSLNYKDVGKKLWRDEWLALKFERLAAIRATQLSSPSKALAVLLGKSWGFDAKQVKVVPYPIDSERFSPSQNAREQANKSRVILYVGSLGKSKGTRVLIDAIGEVLGLFPDVKLRLIGHQRNDLDIPDKNYKDYVERTLDAHLSARIEFVGRVDRASLIREYQGCYLTVVPSTWFENFPNTCLEAMACGRPVIGSSTGGIPEIIRDKETGLLVPKGDVKALTRALIQLLSNERQAEELGAAGRKRVELNFARPIIVEQTLNMYRDAYAAKNAHKNS